MSSLAAAKKKFTTATPATFATPATQPGISSNCSESSDGSSAKNRWPYTRAEDEPRCPTCRHWWAIPGEAVGDCLLHGFETLERDNCKGHDPQQASAFRRNGR